MIQAWYVVPAGSVSVAPTVGTPAATAIARMRSAPVSLAWLL